MVVHQDSIILKEFHELKPELEKWGVFVDKVLNDFLKSLNYSQERIPYFPSHRLKSDDSYLEKAIYRDKGYNNPILEITDKVGTRVVLLNIDDVELVSKFIIDNDAWTLVEQAQNFNDIRDRDPHEFKYQSNHFIVKPAERYGEVVDSDLLTCEIQVRSLLMHVYAETSHDTMYKKGYNGDPKMERSLAITMAFLEAADEKIKYIYEKAESMKTERNERILNLAELYREFVPEFNNNDINYEMAESLMKIFDESYLNQFFSEIPSFITVKHDDIKYALSSTPLPLIFCQPICLIAFYTIIKKQSFLIDNWPFSKESLYHILMAMGISDDVMN